jgi:hypothetical protein
LSIFSIQDDCAPGEGYFLQPNKKQEIGRFANVMIETIRQCSVFFEQERQVNLRYAELASWQVGGRFIPRWPASLVGDSKEEDAFALGSYRSWSLFQSKDEPEGAV